MKVQNASIEQQHQNFTRKMCYNYFGNSSIHEDEPKDRNTNNKHLILTDLKRTDK